MEESVLPEFLIPDWPAPANVRALQTTRPGGTSSVPWASFNLGDHVGDHTDHVWKNRRRLRRELPGEPFWLKQVHGTLAVNAANSAEIVEADASYARQVDVVCAVMTADCLPVLLCDRAGTVVAAVHAGWRGLCAGVIEATIGQMAVPSENLLAWLGPAIGPRAFEVGDEVRAAFLAADAGAQTAFVANGAGKWLADLYVLARRRLNAIGLTNIHGGDHCTYSDASRFFSFRRDGVTGRMASLIWLDSLATGV